MFPAGAQGPALLAFGNFRTIKRYNNSDAYVIAVGHLSDRLRGAGPFVTAWPRTDRPLNSDERVELQRLLNARGFDTGGVDGRIGPMTIEAVRGYQVASGLTPDGYVSLDLLSRLRR
jgi:membrane-bound lytic murein transglycosylase B